MGPDCTEIFFFFKAAATSGISFLLYQSSDSVMSPGVMVGREVLPQVTPGQGGGSGAGGQKEYPTLVSVQC